MSISGSMVTSDDRAAIKVAIDTAFSDDDHSFDENDYQDNDQRLPLSSGTYTTPTINSIAVTTATNKTVLNADSETEASKPKNNAAYSINPINKEVEETTFLQIDQQAIVLHLVDTLATNGTNQQRRPRDCASRLNAAGRIPWTAGWVLGTPRFQYVLPKVAEEDEDCSDKSGALASGQGQAAGANTAGFDVSRSNVQSRRDSAAGCKKSDSVSCRVKRDSSSGDMVKGTGKIRMIPRRLWSENRNPPQSSTFEPEDIDEPLTGSIAEACSVTSSTSGAVASIGMHSSAFNSTADCASLLVFSAAGGQTTKNGAAGQSYIGATTKKSPKPRIRETTTLQHSSSSRERVSDSGASRSAQELLSTIQSCLNTLASRIKSLGRRIACLLYRCSVYNVNSRARKMSIEQAMLARNQIITGDSREEEDQGTGSYAGPLVTLLPEEWQYSDAETLATSTTLGSQRNESEAASEDGSMKLKSKLRNAVRLGRKPKELVTNLVSYIFYALRV